MPARVSSVPTRCTAGAVLAALVALTVPAPAAGADASAAVPAGCQTAQREEGPFRSVAKPAELLPGPLVASAVEPADPRTVYLADPTRVVASADAGCTWELVLDVAPAGPRTRVHELVVPDSAAPTGRLHVAVVDDGVKNFASPSRVLVRRGHGQPFVASAVPPLSGLFVAPAPSDPDVVYAGSADIGSGTVLQRSGDGGATYTPALGSRSSPSGESEVDSEAVGVDPADSARVLVAGNGLFESRDGGGSFVEVLDQSTLLTTHGMAVHPSGGDASGGVFAVGAEFNNSQVSPDSGSAWRVTPGGSPVALPRTGLEGVPDGVAVGRDAEELVIAVADLPGNALDGYDGPGALFLLDEPAQTWVDVSDGRGHPLVDPVVDRTDDPSVHLHSSSLTEPPGADEYVVYSPPARGRIVPPTVDDGSGSGTAPPVAQLPPAPASCPEAGPFPAPEVTAARPARLTPGRAELVPDAGGTARQPYALDLPATPGPLDVYFLLDVSGSMSPVRDGLVCALERLTTTLTGQGIDLRVGLGTFYDRGAGQRYERVVDLAPPDLPLQRGLRTRRFTGGDETHRTALLQTATGAGLRAADGTVLVEPGQQASFRDDALKVVVHLTDEPWAATTADEPSPLAVVDALAGRGIDHVGVQVLNALSPRPGAGQGDRVEGVAGSAALRAQLEQFSIGTGTYAPAGGVDCDGDGSADLREGEPLVCSVDAAQADVTLGTTVLQLLRGVEDRQPVRLQAAGPGLEVSVAPAQHDDVDLRSDTAHDFTVTAACAPGAAQPQVALAAYAGTRQVATSTASVLCAAAPPPAGAADPVPPAGAVPAATGDAPVLAPAGDASAAGPAGVPPAAPPPVVQVPAPAPAVQVAPAAAAAAAQAPAAAGAGAAAVAVAGSAGTAAAGGGAASSAGAAAAAPGSSAALAGTPERAGRRAQAVITTASGSSADVPLAAVPLSGGLLATAALTTSLLASRRRAVAPATVRTRRTGDSR